jgi:hypothetical protein
MNMIAPSANMNPKNRMKRRMPAFAGWATGRSARPLIGPYTKGLLRPKLWRKQGLRERIEAILPCVAAIAKRRANKNPGIRPGFLLIRGNGYQRLNL